MKRTNIVLDEKLVQRARKITGMPTVRALVDFALRELIRRDEMAKLQQLEGAIEWEGDLSQMRASREQCAS